MPDPEAVLSSLSDEPKTEYLLSLDSPDAPSLQAVGARIKRLRLSQGLSVRDVAERAGVDKNTVLRLEKGLPTSGRTLHRICAALDVYVSRILLPEPEDSQPVVIHRQVSETWWPYPGMGEPFPERGEGVSLSPPSPLPHAVGEGGVDAPGSAAASGSEILSPPSPTAWGRGPGGEGSARTAVASLACHMPRGRLRSSLLKLWEETTPNAHPGEELVYCLQGSVCLTVAGRSYVLNEGDAATFWCAERHTYAPALADPETLPALILTVWLDAREERK